MNQSIKEEIGDVKNIFSKLKKKDLSGNAGQAIKNSSYQLAITLVAKIGSLFFTIIVARLMLPEIYGLYGLALSTILILGVFSDIGISAALNTFISKTIDKLPGKAKGYFIYITKWRIALSILSILLIILLSKYLALIYYQKPIYYALLAGTIYLPIVITQSHLKSIFISSNNFRPLLVQEIILQILKLTLVPLIIILFLAKITNIGVYLSWIFLILAACYLIATIYFIWKIKKDKPFKQTRSIDLSDKEQKELKRFILPLTVTALSGIFFGYIDQIMLGHYVESAFLGFYQASFNLATSAAAIVAFSGVAIFPILARLKGKKLERGFRKTRNITIIVSVLAAIFTLILAPLIIKTIYGPLYSTAITYLRIFSILIITSPLVVLYTTYYTSQKRTKIISILLIISTTINIILNYILINIGLHSNMFQAVNGACMATTISQLVYLGGLVIFKKRN